MLCIFVLQYQFFCDNNMVLNPIHVCECDGLDEHRDDQLDECLEKQ